MSSFRQYAAVATMAFTAAASGADEGIGSGLTIDKVASDLALPMGDYARYFNRGMNVTISEKCAVDEADPDTIYCKVSARNLEGLLVSKQTQSYSVTGDGALKISTTLDQGGKWGKYDTNHWDTAREKSASSFDGEHSTVGTAMKADGLSIANGRLFPQNNDFRAEAQGRSAVEVSSVLPVNDKRAFSLSMEFDRSTTSVTFATATHVSFGDGVATVGAPEVSRQWQGRDKHLFNQYRDMAGTGGPGFGSRE